MTLKSIVCEYHEETRAVFEDDELPLCRLTQRAPSSPLRLNSGSSPSTTDGPRTSPPTTPSRPGVSWVTTTRWLAPAPLLTFGLPRSRSLVQSRDRSSAFQLRPASA